jgi:hypothetical protein
MQPESSANHGGKLDPLPAFHLLRGPSVLRRPANRLPYATTLFATAGLYRARRHPTLCASRAKSEIHSCLFSRRASIEAPPYRKPHHTGVFLHARAARLVGLRCVGNTWGCGCLHRKSSRASCFRVGGSVGGRSVVFFNRHPNPSVERTHNGGARLFAPSPSAAPLCAAHRGRVCRTWHSTHGVEVPVPGGSAAAGEEPGTGVPARWGPEAGPSQEAGRRPGTGDAGGSTRDARARDRDVLQARWGVRAHAGVAAAPGRGLPPGGRHGVQVAGRDDRAGQRRESRRPPRKHPACCRHDPDGEGRDPL